MNDLVTPATSPGLIQAAANARAAGRCWAAAGLAIRLGVIGRARRLMAARAMALAATVRRPLSDTLVAEVLPLLEAARFLERRAPGLLATQRLRRGRPLWLFGVSAEVQRDALGAVLILGPGNYPLFLPGAQTLQALAAGNAVCLKPAPEGVDAAAAFAAVLADAGLPQGVLQVLDHAFRARRGGGRVRPDRADRLGRDRSARPDRGGPASDAGDDGAVRFRRGVRPARRRSGPGCTLPAYGLRLNGGATCIAPRRVFVPRDLAGALEAALAFLLPQIPDAMVPGVIAGRLAALLNQAVAMGGRVLEAGKGRPSVLADARPEMALLQHDVFAPWLALIPVADTEAALRDDALCPFALGASVFGPVAEARALAAGLRVGSVCINDLIVPTADPRLPFGGSGRAVLGGPGAPRGCWR